MATKTRKRPKTLNLTQLRELGIYNPHVFSGSGGFYLLFIPYTRQTMRSFGWWVCGANRKFKPDPYEVGISFDAPKIGSGRSTPQELRPHLEPVLARLGILWPAEWVRFMGHWWPAAFHAKRMEFLIDRYVNIDAEAGE